MTDHYTTLGVSKTATQDEIKLAFRKLASQHHPDKGGDTAKFQEIQQAYDVLGDARRRAEYDRPQPQFNNFNGFSTNFDMNDIFSMFTQGFGAQQARRTAGHVRLSLWISLVDVATGGRRTVNLGTAQGTSTVEIDIPVGINDGDNVQYAGLGPGGVDLVVQFRVHPHPNWERHGLNIITNHAVSIWDLVVGGDITVTDLLGNSLTTHVPAGSQPTTMMRLRGRGLKDRNGQVGDIYVRLNPTVPANIAPEIVAAIKQYR